MLHSSRQSLLVALLISFSVLSSPVNSQDNGPQVQVEKRTDGRYVVDVTLHTLPEIEALLNRAEKLHQTSKGKNLKDSSTGIALVLHGEEIKFFAKKQYQKNKKIIDKAKKLDANNIIDIKICRTKLRELGLKKDDIPPFIETVPFGPAEIKKLRSKGYLYL
jgi:intracellular sulfur oxidation DsrE/DsrF family protein